MRKLNLNDVNDILRLRYVDGMTIREIAGKFGVSSRRIQQILQNPTLSKPGRKKQKIPSEIAREIVDLYSEGLGIPAIHEILNEKGYRISQYLIWRYLKENGLIRSKPRNSDKCSLALFLKKCAVGYCSFLGVLYFPKNGKCYHSRIIFGIGFYNGVPLKCSIFGFDRMTLNALLMPLSSFVPKSSKAVIVKAPPWVPTRGENKLLKFLRRKGVTWIWVPYCNELRHLAGRLTLEDSCSDTHLIRRTLLFEFKKLMEVE